MSFRPRFPAMAALLIVLASLAGGVSHAEDPFLGQIREIKCVNCRPGWVTLVVHDPIEIRDFELYLKDSDYNKIITPLPGKRIHDRNGECFYWMERPKKTKRADVPRPGVPPAAESTGTVGGAGVAGGNAPADSNQAVAAAGSGPESTSAVPPPEPQGTPSACVRFYHEIK